jgi:predicted nucleic acid-binding protein
VIAYFDTSALIPLLIEEPGSVQAERLWDVADRVVSARLVYAEGRAALAQARRLGRTDQHGLDRLVEQFDGLYRQIDRIELDEPLVRRAGAFAQEHHLRGYDAVHLAAADRIRDLETVLAAGDQQLCDAAHAIGLAVADTR